MNDSNCSIANDGRLTVVLLLLFGLLVFDIGKGHQFFFSQKSKDIDSCQQLQYVQPDGLVVTNCSVGGEGHDNTIVSPRLSPFLFAAMPINSAEKEMLMTVDGIGPALAEEIIVYRRQFGHFTSSSDLLNLPGIGPKRATKLAKAFTFTKKP